MVGRMIERNRLSIGLGFLVLFLVSTDFTPALQAADSPAGPSERMVVTVHSDTRLRGWVLASVAESDYERYIGLSETEELASDSGMLFVYRNQAPRTFVMRGMEYPLDMIFVGEDRRIRRIARAHVEQPGEPSNRYRGQAKWVLEVPLGWSRARGVRRGDRVIFRTPAEICRGNVPMETPPSRDPWSDMVKQLCKDQREGQS